MRTIDAIHTLHTTVVVSWALVCGASSLYLMTHDFHRRADIFTLWVWLYQSGFFVLALMAMTLQRVFPRLRTLKLSIDRLLGPGTFALQFALQILILAIWGLYITWLHVVLHFLPFLVCASYMLIHGRQIVDNYLNWHMGLYGDEKSKLFDMIDLGSLWRDVVINFSLPALLSVAYNYMFDPRKAYFENGKPTVRIERHTIESDSIKSWNSL